MAAKPRWDLDDALRRARVANRLAVKNRVALERRLEAGLLEQLQSDRAFLGDPEARDTAALRKQKTSTAAEREAAAKGYGLVLGVREIAKRHKGVSDELRVALGVGDKLSANDTDGVATALANVIARAADLAALGVLPEDVEEATELRTRLLAADAAQSNNRDDRESTTEDRNDAHLRIEAAIDQISSRAAFAFRRDAALAARFERLVAGSGPSTDDEREAGDEPAPVGPPPADGT